MEYKFYIAGGIITVIVVAFYWIFINQNSK